MEIDLVKCLLLSTYLKIHEVYEFLNFNLFSFVSSAFETFYSIRLVHLRLIVVDFIARFRIQPQISTAVCAIIVYIILFK
jgi:hypothetical protein